MYSDWCWRSQKYCSVLLGWKGKVLMGCSSLRNITTILLFWQLWKYGLRYSSFGPMSFFSVICKRKVFPHNPTELNDENSIDVLKSIFRIYSDILFKMLNTYFCNVNFIGYIQLTVVLMKSYKISFLWFALFYWLKQFHKWTDIDHIPVTN